MKRIICGGAALLLGIGCGAPASSSLELEVSGEASGVAVDLKGPWKLCGGESDCRPFAYVNMAGEGAFLATPFFAPEKQPDGFMASARFDIDWPYLKVTEPRQEVRLEFNQVRTDGSATGTGRVYAGVTVSRVYFTGDASEPWKAELLIDSAKLPYNTPLLFKGKAVIAPRCTQDVEDLQEVETPCGAGEPSQPEERFYADMKDPIGSFDQASDSALCPKEVFNVFMPENTTLKGDFATRTIRAGSGEPLKCVKTGVGRIMCGASKQGVQADGCSWDVDALYGMGRRQGLQLAVGARASGCDRVVKHCSN